MKKIILFLCFLILCINMTGYARSVPSWAWTKSARAYSNQCQATSNATDKEGNVYVTGTYERYMVMGSDTFNSNTTSSFLLKYDGSGNMMWAKNIDSVNTSKITIDGDDNIYLTGTFTYTATLGQTTLRAGSKADLFVAKYDGTGNVIWAKSAGGSSYDYGLGLATDKNGNVYVSGYFQSSVIAFDTISISYPGNDNNKMFIAKYNSAGSILWVKSLASESYANSIATDTAGNFFVTGLFIASTVAFDSIVLTNTVSGGTGISLFVVKYNRSGKAVWARTDSSILTAPAYGSGIGEGITTDIAGNVLVVGTLNSAITFGKIRLSSYYNDIFILKYTNAGDLLWAKQAGPACAHEGICIATDTAGNIYTTGKFHKPGVSFDSINFVFSPLPTSDTYGHLSIAKFDPAGNVLFAFGLQTGEGTGLSADRSGNVYVSGSYNLKPFFVGKDTLTLFGVFNGWFNNNSSVFVGKLGNCFTNGGTITSSNDTFCEGTAITHLAVKGNEGNIQWQSSTDGTHFSATTSKDTSAIYTTPISLDQTTYYRIITNNNCGSDSSNIVQVHIVPSPSTNFTYAMNGRQINFQPDSVSSNVTLFHWDFGDGKISSEANPTHTFDSIKTYYVCLTVYNGSNCSYTFCKYISLLSTGDVAVSANPSIQLYPNPANNTLNLSVNGLQGNYELKIYNVLGQQVKAIPELYLNNNENIPIDLSDVFPGTYELILMNGKEYFSKRFVHL